MSASESQDLTMMLDILEGELEERKIFNDRRKTDSVDGLSESIENERRKKTDRRMETI